MSELRQDPVSGDWIILAPERVKRPHAILEKGSARKPSSKTSCPFESQNIANSLHWPPLLSSPNEKKWRVVVAENKYPAVSHASGCSIPAKLGPHFVKTGSGAHDLVITREHAKNFADLDLNRATEVFLIMQKRLKDLAKDGCNLYTSVFFNWGKKAGASVFHPHYQVLTLPIIPPDISHSLNGSEKYFVKHRRCVHCVMLAFDAKEKKRVIDQNERAISLAPFVSRVPFEVRVFPKKHTAEFQKTPLNELRSVAEMLQRALKRIRRNLRDPDLNFFIHTAPLKGGKYDYYHWHVEINPKITPFGGFELGTGVEINVVDPARAAKILRGDK